VCYAHTFYSHYGFEPFLQLTAVHQLSKYGVYIYLHKLLVHGCTFIWYTTYLLSDTYSHLVQRAHSFSILKSSHPYTLIGRSAGVTLYVHTYLDILLFSIFNIMISECDNRREYNQPNRHSRRLISNLN